LTYAVEQKCAPKGSKPTVESLTRGPVPRRPRSPVPVTHATIPKAAKIALNASKAARPTTIQTNSQLPRATQEPSSTLPRAAVKPVFTPIFNDCDPIEDEDYAPVETYDPIEDDEGDDLEDHAGFDGDGNLKYLDADEGEEDANDDDDHAGYEQDVTVPDGHVDKEGSFCSCQWPLQC